MKIIAFGDIHMDYQAADDIPVVRDADLLIITGDLTNFGGRDDAEAVLSAVRSLNKNIYALPGNLDQPAVGVFLDEIGINLHGKGIKIGGIGIFGVGGSNVTPFNTPTEFLENELYRLAIKGYKEIASLPVKIFVSHTPPLNTSADRIKSGVHVGSEAIRRFIEEKQPDLCLTGHIHEARGEDRIGKTVILNPGMLKVPGWIEIECDETGVRVARLNQFLA
ncbi:metallophosphoesterase [Dissulfurimicrobium hydrothermale]|uniref:metallophosphoesterase n=1 Tax=Dissulfurimicrobium hydrothermale TaxID=1750598 RepID=UPI001EDBFF73|nr:metallophosphoesterase [Dissulfurimicrobium hydrothermale]UKL13382.1 metallophosphoesterase [Dissulfurimicrobium hydrothermale]